MTAIQIYAKLKKFLSDPVSLTAEKRRLRDADLSGHVSIQKPLLGPQNILSK